MDKPQALGVGERLGRYVIRKPLAAGGMGEVYLAHDPELDRAVALKLLRPELLEHEAGSSEGRARLLREAQALARLSHPNVIAVYDVGTAGQQIFIAMEYLEGHTLRAWLQEQPRSWRQVVELFLQAGQGLAAAHAAGLVHRDFNPSNVLLGKDRRVCVVDFGLARPAGTAPQPLALEAQAPEAQPLEPTSTSALESPLTQEGALVGTPGYMSPEQLLGEPVEAHSDQFSYCVALYEALYGQRPFPARTLPEYVKQVLSGPLPAQPRGSPVPAWVHALVLKGLARSPAERFGSMEALLAVLARDPLAERRRQLQVAAAVVLLLAGAAWLGMRTHPPPPCQGSEQKLAGVWDEGRRQALRQAFLATRRPYAQRAWRSVERELDRYTRAWVAQHTQACEDTRVHGRQSEAVMLQRLLCLEQRRQEVGALVAVLSQADAEVVAQAARSARELQPLAACTDLRGSLSQELLPAEPEARARVEELQGRLAHARALYSAGRYSQARQEAEPLVEAAQVTGHEPLIADALLLLASAQYKLLDLGQAERHAHQAAAAALAAGRLDEAAQAWLLLSRIVMSGQLRVEEAERWALYARKSLARAGDPAELLGSYERQLALVYTIAGARADALVHARRAVELLEAAKSPELGDALSDLSQASARAGLGQEAVEAARRALALAEESFGSEHPQATRARSLLALGLAHVGDLRQALAEQQRTIELEESLYGAQSPRLASSLHNLAYHYMLLGQYAEVVRVEERALKLLEQTPNPRAWPYVGSLQSLAQARLAQGQAAQALALAREALALNEVALGRDSPRLANTLTLLGLTELRLGRARKALELLERAHALRQREQPPPEETGITRLALAQALWALGEQRPRSLELLAQARQDFQRAGARAQQFRAMWEAWVAAHKPQVPASE